MVSTFGIVAFFFFVTYGQFSHRVCCSYIGFMTTHRQLLNFLYTYYITVICWYFNIQYSQLAFLTYILGWYLAKVTAKSINKNKHSSFLTALIKYGLSCILCCVLSVVSLEKGVVNKDFSLFFQVNQKNSVSLRVTQYFVVGAILLDFLQYFVIEWNPAIKDFIDITEPPESVSSAGKICVDDNNITMKIHSKSKKIKSGQFYKEYHSHKIKHLIAIKQQLTKLNDKGKETTFIYLMGDSSLDNKHWFFDSNKSKSTQMKNDSFTAPACNGYENILVSPSRMVQDVSYHMNEIAEQRYGSNNICTIMGSIEESTISDRNKSSTSLLAQDAFIQSQIKPNDYLIISVGGNDIALNPTLSTAIAMALLTRSPVWMIEYGIAPGFSYFVDLFSNGIEDIVLKVINKNIPKEILINMIYYPDVVPGGSWADDTLRILGYDSNPEKLQLIIRTLFEAVKKKDFPKLKAYIKRNQSDSKVTAFPLFEVLNEHEDYEQRVEPSVQGGRKMAEAFLDALHSSIRYAQ